MHFALRSLNGQRCATSPKSEKINFCATRQKVFFIGIFEYTLVSVGKGGFAPPPPFGPVFFVKKKTNRVIVISAPFWAFGKSSTLASAGFKSSGHFFSLGKAGSLNFKNFYRISGV
jgi:hypothetical protein